MNARTSTRGKWGLGLLVSGYFAIAVVAGVPMSPLTVPLPAGASPPAWATTLARVVGLDHVSRHGLIGISWVFVVIVLAAFVLLVREAWSGRVQLPAVLAASAISLAISVAAPLLLSRDVYTYAAYGRLVAHGQNPYVATLASFAHDPFVAVASRQWLHTHSHYGAAFTLVSAGIARLWAGSPGATILAFKLLAGLALAAATVFAALAATRVRPERAPLAAALVGLNPVLVVHTVGGAHVDALIAAPLAAAMAVAVTGPPAMSAKAIAVTVLLTVACLIKTVIVPVLVLWLWWLFRREPRRGRMAAAHLVVVASLVIAAVAPFAAGSHTFASLTSFGGLESWASPSHLVGRGAQALAGQFAGSAVSAGLAKALEGAFLALFVILLWRLMRDADGTDAAGTWGVALLLLALSLPYLLPWYAAWFAPFLGIFADNAFVLVGVFVTAVLALTLIPADPFHGLTSSAVMDGVHYGAASVLLVVLLVLAARVLGIGRRVLSPLGSPATSRAA